MNKTHTNILILLIVTIAVTLYFGFNRTGFSQAQTNPTGADTTLETPISDLPQGGSCTGSFTVPPSWAGYCLTDIAIVWGGCSNADTVCQQRACNNHANYYPGVCSWQNNACEPTTDPGGTFQCSNLTRAGQARCGEYPGCSWGGVPLPTTIPTMNNCDDLLTEINQKAENLKLQGLSVEQIEQELKEQINEYQICIAEGSSFQSNNAALTDPVNISAWNAWREICNLVGGC